MRMRFTWLVWSLLTVALISMGCDSPNPIPTRVATNPLPSPTLLSPTLAPTRPVVTPAYTATPITTPSATPTPPHTSTALPYQFVTQLRFVDLKHGWVLGTSAVTYMDTYVWLAIMSRTIDGGRTWQRIPAPADHVDGIQFFTAKEGLAWGPGLYTTIDGGDTWHDISPSEHLQAVDAKDGIAWMLVGDCPGQEACNLELRISNDHGKTWFNSLRLHDFVTLDIRDGVMWLIERTCVAQQTRQCTYKLHISRDKGQGWDYANMQIPVEGSDYQLLRANATDAWIISRDIAQPASADYDAQYKHYLISTGDGGQSWQVRPQPCPASTTGRGVGFEGGYIWLVCTGIYTPHSQHKVLYVSSDRGAHWTLRATAEHDQSGGLEPRYALRDFGAISPKIAWMIYSKYASAFTFDGGYTWVGTGVDDGGGGGMGPVVFVDSMHGWFGSRWAIYYTEDGGHTWTATPLTAKP